MAANARIGLEAFVNGSGRAISAMSGDILVRCGFCLKTFHPYRPSQRFCGARHRLLFWAAGELVKEVEAGGAPGLRDMIIRLKT